MSTDGHKISTQKDLQASESCVNADAEKTLNLIDLFKAKSSDDRLLGKASEEVIPLAFSTNNSLLDAERKPLRLSSDIELLSAFSVQDSNSKAKQKPSIVSEIPGKNEILPQIILDDA